MANEQNLIPGFHTLTVEEQSRGGKKSAEARREKKLIRERILERMGEDDWDEFIDGIISRAKESTQAAEFLRDTIGEKPKDSFEVQGEGIEIRVHNVG